MIKKINLILPVLAFILCNYLALNNMKMSQVLLQQVSESPTNTIVNNYSENRSPSLNMQPAWGDVGLVSILETPEKINFEKKRTVNQLFLSIEEIDHLNGVWTGPGNNGLNLNHVGKSQNKIMMKSSDILLP